MFCVWPLLNKSCVSDLCLSGGYTFKHPGEKMSDDAEIWLCFNDVFQLSVDLRRPGERPAFLLLYCTSIIAADNGLFA